MENQTITQKQLPRDVFLYLLNIITLGMASINFGVLLFQFINIYLPDVLDRYTSANAYDDSIRWAVATLIIIFPVYAWTMRFLDRDVVANPEKKELKVRKWLLYLAVFITALIIIGDLVAVMYTFLNGELTARFAAKVGVILLIAGSIFYYYLNTLRDHHQAALKFLAKATITVVSISMVAGLFIAGLPQNRRIQQIDEQRVGDLQNIQNQIVYYWQAKQKLPTDLNDLKSDINGVTIPTDPETKQSYDYAVLGALKFKLCATFKSDGTVSDVSRPIPVSIDGTTENWSHGVGNVCFERTIDPDRNPPLGKPVPLR